MVNLPDDGVDEVEHAENADFALALERRLAEHKHLQQPHTHPLANVAQPAWKS